MGIDSINCSDFDEMLVEFREVDVKSQNLSYIHPSYADGFGAALIDGNKPSVVSQ